MGSEIQNYFLDWFSGFGAGVATGAIGLLGWTFGAGTETGAGFWLVPPGDVGDSGFWNGLKPNPALEAQKDKHRPKREINNLDDIQFRIVA